MQPFADVDDLAGLPRTVAVKRPYAISSPGTRRNRRAASRVEGRQSERDRRDRRLRRGEADRGDPSANGRGGDRRQHHHLLRVLRPDPRDEQQARAERAGDCADRVGRVDDADKPRGILPGRRHRREGERKARAPEERRRQHRPQRAHEIELEVQPRCPRESAGLIGQYGSDASQLVRRPRDRRHRQQLAPAERHAWPRRSTASADPAAAADPEADQKHGEDDARTCRPSRRRAGRAAASRSLRRRAREARQRDGQVHGPRGRPAKPDATVGLATGVASRLQPRRSSARAASTHRQRTRQRR